MTSPLSMPLSTMCATSEAYSLGRPRRAGWGTCASRAAVTSSGRPASIGVAKVPGATVTTRMSLSARSRAAGEGEGDDATLGRGIRGLSDLSVEGGDGRCHHDDPAVTVNRLVLAHGLGGQAEDVERADQVDVNDGSEGLELQGDLCGR
jgi:hypothetical protein